jgi:hypothetical protein
MDLKQLDFQINEAGTALSAINDAAVGLINDGIPVTTLAPVLAPLYKASKAFSAIQGMSTAAQNAVQITAPKNDLPPGMVVADVGSADTGAYTGPVDASKLTLGNLAFIDRNLGGFSNKWGQVFNAKPRFPDQPGVLANAVPDTGTPDGYDLRSFLGKPDNQPNS